MSTDTTFFWHDYETFGRDPLRDRPSQFAGLRTDSALNIIEEPVMYYCRPSADYLPDPEACLLTQLTPQKALHHGLSEAEFAAKVQQHLGQAGTCGVGYNTLRFDDEFSRALFYRNFYDPYAREWQSGNSRWDLVDVVRACRALRPEGIEWPLHPDGKPNNKLEALSQANQLSHEQAHDALSDVYATVALAKLLREKQPKLFDYALTLRHKQAVSERLNWNSGTPVVHVSGHISGEYLSTALMMPLAPHPKHQNTVLCWDLRYDPEPLLTLDVDALEQRLYTPIDQLESPSERVAIKQIHINKSPFVAPLATLNAEAAERCRIDKAAQLQHQLTLHGFRENWQAKLQQMFSKARDDSPRDPELALYSGGFTSPYDKRQMTQLRQLDPQTLASKTLPFEDSRFAEMLFRYRARNHPETLSEDEQQQWLEHCRAKLVENQIDPKGRSFAAFQESLETLVDEKQDDDDAMALLAEVSDWAEQIEYALQADS